MKKSFTGFVLTLALALLIFPTKTFAKDTATIAVSNATAKAGETAEMVVLVETDSGISGAGLTVRYNTTALTLTDIRPLASGTFLEDIDYASFSWLKGKNLSGSFELAVLSFAVDASAGGDYTVEVRPIGDLTANITNEKAAPVAATFVPGVLSIVKESVDDEEEPTPEDPATEDPEPSDTVTPDVPSAEDPKPSGTAATDAPATEDPKPDSTLDVEESPSKEPEADKEQDSGEPEEEKPQPSQTTPTTPTEKPVKESGNIGLYAAVVAAAAVGFAAGTVRKKRK